METTTKKDSRISTKTMEKVMDYAVETCEDWKPLRQWECKEVEFVWFTEKQLKQLIKHCIEIGRAEAVQ